MILKSKIVIKYLMKRIKLKAILFYVSLQNENCKPKKVSHKKKANSCRPNGTIFTQAVGTKEGMPLEALFNTNDRLSGNYLRILPIRQIW